MTPAGTEIQRALAVVALMVVRHGPAYMPLLDRLEREEAAEAVKNGRKDRASAVLARLTREVRNVPAA